MGMTNEEAIDILDNLIGMVEDNHKSDYDTALQMAIKALEQEPCNYAISLETVIEWLKTKDIIKMSSQEETARRELKALPSVKPTKTGHWKKWEYGTHRCSICDKIIGRERYPYCPNCGASMVDPQERSGEE